MNPDSKEVGDDEERLDEKHEQEGKTVDQEFKELGFQFGGTGAADSVVPEGLPGVEFDYFDVKQFLDSTETGVFSGENLAFSFFCQSC